MCYAHIVTVRFENKIENIGVRLRPNPAWKAAEVLRFKGCIARFARNFSQYRPLGDFEACSY
jgi:hypothetical protein